MNYAQDTSDNPNVYAMGSPENSFLGFGKKKKAAETTDTSKDTKAGGSTGAQKEKTKLNIAGIVNTGVSIVGSILGKSNAQTTSPATSLLSTSSGQQSGSDKEEEKKDNTMTIVIIVAAVMVVGVIIAVVVKMKKKK